MNRVVTRVLLVLLLVVSAAMLLALTRPGARVETGPAAPQAAATSGEALPTNIETVGASSPDSPERAGAASSAAVDAPYDAGGPSQEGAEAVDERALPACTYDDLPAPRAGYDEWDRTVLDTVFALPPDYVPPDLVPAAPAFAGRPGGADFKVRALLLDDLTALLAAAAEDGVALAIQSAYRSYGYQEDTFQYWVDLNGRQAALATSARPGHSEHQLGTALDFRSLDGPPAWELSDWASTEEGAWMAENAWRFGFVMSYPRGSRELTCYSYEPWHYRYLGRAVAAEVRRTGLTPRELLWAAHLAERSE